MGLFKRGSIWWCSITYNGKQHRFSLKTSNKSEAQTVYAQVLLKLRNTEKLPSSSKPELIQKQTTVDITFEEFYEKHYLTYCYNRQAYYEVKKYLLNKLPEWFKKLKLCDIGIRELELVQNYLLEQKKAIATCNRYIANIQASFTKAYEWNYITEDKLKRVRKVKKIKGEISRLRFLSQDEIKALLNNCEPHLYQIVFTALNTGMRKSEILNLKWENIDLNYDLILLEKTKNGERREIPINEPLKKLFKQLITKRRLDTEYVFVNPETGKRYIDLKRSFATACKKAGIRDFHFHDLRHTFASQLVMNGVDLKTVQELLGHKDIKMTLRYAHLSQAHKKEAVKLLGNLVYHNSITILSRSK